MTPRAAWAELGLPAASDAARVREVYARRLREMDPDTDPAAFARLRAARDVALADLMRRATNVVVGEALDDLNVPQDSWPHAAPQITLPIPPGRVTAKGGPVLEPEPNAFVSASAPAETPLHMPITPLVAPVVALSDNGDVLANGGRGGALQSLLGASAPSDPLTDDEEHRALGHLEALLGQIAAMTIEQSRHAEDWIADVLVRAWPRSAPLLGPASAGFGWLNEHGQLGERPSIGFLNARLRGMRFVGDVEVPGHTLHKAWLELSRPGFKRSWWIKSKEVRLLLEGIRKNFPEVERYLDPQRVSAWEQTIWPSPRFVLGGFTSSFKPVRLWWFALFIAIRIVFGAYQDNKPHPAVRPLALSTEPAAGSTQIALDKAAARWFGKGTAFADVSHTSPMIAAMASSRAGNNPSIASAENAMRDAVFMGLHIAVAHADHKTLRAVQQLRLSVFDAARQVDAETCFDFMTLSWVEDQVRLSDEQQARARALIAQLAKTGLFTIPATKERHTAAVPGTVMERIMAETRLPREGVQIAMNHQGPHPAQCAVHRALINEALHLPGSQGDAILRVE